MTTIITRHWWALALRGVLAVLLGVFAIAFPPATFVLLAMLIAAYLALDGVVAVVAGVRAAERHRRWWPFLVEGALDLVAGAIIFFDPDVLVFLVAVWAIATGLFMLAPAFTLPGGSGKWFLVLNGLISLALGVAILAKPIAGLLFIAWSVGIYALIFGTGLIALGLHVRALHGKVYSGP